MCYRLKSYRPKPFSRCDLFARQFLRQLLWLRHNEKWVLIKQFPAGLEGFDYRIPWFYINSFKPHSLIFHALEVKSLWVCLTCAAFRSCWSNFNSWDKSFHLILSATRTVRNSIHRNVCRAKFAVSTNHYC